MTQTVSRPTASAELLVAETIPGAFQRAVAAYPDRIAIQTVNGTTRYTWSQLDGRVRRIAAGLAALGIGEADTVAIMLPNTIDCHAIDFAAGHLGAVPFAIFNSSPTEHIEHQLRVADAAVVITQNSFLDKVCGAVGNLGDQVRYVVVVDDKAPDGVMTLATLERLSDRDFDLDAVWTTLTASHLAALIFTSGTTGPPKAAQWSHRTVMAQLRAMDAALPLPKVNVVSFLPMAHAGGRISVHYLALAYGATITVCPDPTELMATLARVRPDALFSVPRFWEKIQVAIEAAIDGHPEPQRTQLRRAVGVGMHRIGALDASSAARDDMAALDIAYAYTTSLLRPLLAGLGLDRIRCAFVGGAPSAPELSRYFRAVGVPMLEAYGLTEGSLNIFNRVERFKAGSAGLPLPGVEVRLAGDGELLVRSDLNFVDYRHLPDATTEALDSDGWLHTGDVANIDEEGFVTIVDRKKELIISAAGKNMSPAFIESAVKGQDLLIAHVVAIGDGRRYVTALITLDPDASASVAPADRRERVACAVERANTHLNGNEQVKKFTILPDHWLPDSDELTPTAKLKRRVIHQKYAEHIEELYT